MGDGGTHEGINEGNTIVTYDDLERIHMAPYVDCIAQGISTIMASYSCWNGHKLHGHRYLLTEILKDKLGFKVNNFIVLQYFSKEDSEQTLKIKCCSMSKTDKSFVMPAFQ